MKKFFYSLSLLAVLAFTFSACVKHEFDEPPSKEDQFADTVDYTVAELLAAYHVEDQINPIDISKTLGVTVVSSDFTGNFYKSLVVQDATGGITLRINRSDLNLDYPVGMKLYIKTDGLYVGDYRGLSQLGGGVFINSSGFESTDYISDEQLEANVVISNSVNVIAPAVVSVNGLNASMVNMLVQFNEVQFTNGDKGQTWADAIGQQSVNRTIEDCNENTVDIRSSGYADFAGSFTPEGNGTLIGILSIYNGGFQILINGVSSTDVDMNGDRCGDIINPPGDDIEEDFSSQVDYEDIAITNWTNIATVGTRLWIAKEFSGNTYAQASAYNSGEASSEVWLVTPAINVDVATKKINFESAKAYYDHDGLSVWASTDFTGDPTAATWTQVSCTLAVDSDENHEFIPSGDVSLASYLGGNVYIGFKYLGGDPGATGTFRIDNVVVSE